MKPARLVKLWEKRMLHRLKIAARRAGNTDDFKLGALAFLVGLVGGAGAIVFRYLIALVRNAFFIQGGAALGFLGDAYIVLMPAAGLVLVGIIVRRWAMEAQGHGVPEVQYAVRKEGGYIRPRVAAVKTIASAICIGSGGSVGREGPIVQIGSTFGSIVGRIGKLPRPHVRLMVACGAAAGIGGTFNAPIAGVIFALEVILADFKTRAFGLIVIASVTATALCQAVLGKRPSFELVQIFTLNSAWELPLYALMGMILGLVALLYVRSVYWFEDSFERWRANPNLKAAAGGLFVGLMGYLGSDLIFGVGYEGIELCLRGAIGIKMLVLLVGLKILATSVTLGAGGSGGIFAPSLFIGAMGGGAFGMAAHSLFPGVCAPAGAYALVGMAAVFAGAAHAPITAIIILFEMTDDYKIILPLMLAAVISYLLSSLLGPDSIYDIKLRRRGGLTPDALPGSTLDHILVADAMTTKVRTVKPDVKIGELLDLMRRSNLRSFPVVDEDGKLAGIVTERDATQALMAGKGENETVQDCMTSVPATCLPGQSLRELLENFSAHGVRQMPVVDPKDNRKLLGLLSRDRILWAYGVLAKEYGKLARAGKREAKSL